jgi:hypothetical protein
MDTIWKAGFWHCATSHCDQQCKYFIDKSIALKWLRSEMESSPLASKKDLETLCKAVSEIGFFQICDFEIGLEKIEVNTETERKLSAIEFTPNLHQTIIQSSIVQSHTGCIYREADLERLLQEVEKYWFMTPGEHTDEEKENVLRIRFGGTVYMGSDEYKVQLDRVKKSEDGILELLKGLFKNNGMLDSEHEHYKLNHKRFVVLKDMIAVVYGDRVRAWQVVGAGKRKIDSDDHAETKMIKSSA